MQVTANITEVSRGRRANLVDLRWVLYVFGRNSLAVELHAKLLSPVHLVHSSDRRAVAENTIVDVSLVDGLVSADRNVLTVGVLSKVGPAAGLEAAVVG